MFFPNFIVNFHSIDVKYTLFSVERREDVDLFDSVGALVMSKFDSFEDIINFAIENETEADTGLWLQVGDSTMSQLLGRHPGFGRGL